MKKSTTNDNWCSPPQIVSALLEFTDGVPVRLDPCSNPSSIVGADIEWYGPHAGGTDGLIAPWVHADEGVTFWNPPYSQKFEWTRKAMNEARLGNESIGLVPADTDTQWFHNWVVPCPRRCFWRGRLAFIGDVSHGSRAPSLLPYWGPRYERFQQIFRQYGWVR